MLEKEVTMWYNLNNYMKGTFYMSTALIDRTLSYTDINPEYIDKNELIKYVHIPFYL